MNSYEYECLFYTGDPPNNGQTTYYVHMVGPSGLTTVFYDSNYKYPIPDKISNTNIPNLLSDIMDYSEENEKMILESDKFVLRFTEKYDLYNGITDEIKFYNGIDKIES